MKKILLLSLMLASFAVGNAQQNEQRLNSGWDFIKKELGGIWEVWRVDKHDHMVWTGTELPHCINAFDAVDPEVEYYQGETWYRKLIAVNNPYKNGRTILHFEGAGQDTKVYTYLQQVGEHIGGYDEFKIDITEGYNAFSRTEQFKAFDSKLPLAICCDNSRDLERIPSDLSDFMVYGGLYRYLNLLYVPAISMDYVHVEPVVSDKGKKVNVQIRTKLYNPETLSEDLVFEVKIKSPSGELVHQNSVTMSAFDGEEALFDFELKKPELWSTDQPHLYTCELSLKSTHGVHKLSENFGCRYFRFEEHGPFYLNGERLLIRGTHRHEDHAGVGAAMTEEMIREEMQLMKDMGVNFIRLGHYQQSSIVLDLCDSLGILVWEEIPWCRGGLGGERYQAQAKRMLKNMIGQHYNHPSIILWGLGNENDRLGDFVDDSNDRVKDFMIQLNDLSHELDAGRKTCIRRCEFCKDVVDVYSPSIWAGWYRGKYIEYRQESHKSMQTVKHFVHMEWGGSSHAGRHDEAPDRGLEMVKTGQGAAEEIGDALLTGGAARVSKDGNWSETYICNLFDWCLKEQEEMPWLTGTAQWTFKDFATPLRPDNPIPYVNQKGIVERDLTPKESYYVFQSYWSKKPMLHIYGSNWPVRWGEDGEKKFVKVYSNCSKVELFLNGESLGKKKRDVQDFPAAGLSWNTAFRKGKNTLKAVAVENGQKIEQEIVFNYQTEEWDTPHHFEINETKICEKYSWIEVKLLDKNNVLCLDARNKIKFSVSGDASLVDNLGTADGARVVELSNGSARIKIEKTNAVYSVAVQSEGIPTIKLN